VGVRNGAARPLAVPLSSSLASERSAIEALDNAMQSRRGAAVRREAELMWRQHKSHMLDLHSQQQIDRLEDPTAPGANRKFFFAVAEEKSRERGEGKRKEEEEEEDVRMRAEKVVEERNVGKCREKIFEDILKKSHVKNTRFLIGIHTIKRRMQVTHQVYWR